MTTSSAGSSLPGGPALGGPVPGGSPQVPFPPQDITSFLAYCAGEWLALRSCFELEGSQPAGSAANGGDDFLEDANEAETWHSSERGELLVTYLEPGPSGDAGGLRLRPPQGAPSELHFQLAGGFCSQQAAAASGVEAPQVAGRWQLGPDGSLELTVQGLNAAIVRERIWFTKPNLRLRSSVEHRGDGSPGRASFSSEIRRVARAAASDQPATGAPAKP